MVVKRASNVASSIGSSAVKAVSDLVGDKELSWDELCAIEKRRRNVLKRTELPFFRILFFWDGTVLPMLATDALMWITILIYVLIRVGARAVGMPGFVTDLGNELLSTGTITSLHHTNYIGIIGGCLSFFLVLFVAAYNKRFAELYNTSMRCKRCIFDAAALAKTTLPRERAMRLIRYMNAVHISGYVGLSDTYSFENFFTEINKTNRLLNDKEVERIKRVNMDVGGSASREITVWCCAEISSAQKLGLIDSRLAQQFRELVLQLRDAIGKLYSYKDQPEQFFYVHFVCLLSAIYLPLFAVTAGLAAGTGSEAYWWLNDVIQGLVVLLQCVYVIGLRLLAVKMSDPYGSDVEDLSVMHYSNFNWRMSNRMLNAELPAHNPDLDSEDSLFSEAQDIGGAWTMSANKAELLEEGLLSK